jgi:hypothetical protein
MEHPKSVRDNIEVMACSIGFMNCHVGRISCNPQISTVGWERWMQ